MRWLPLDARGTAWTTPPAALLLGCSLPDFGLDRAPAGPIDTDRDGCPDYALYDTAGSKKPDLIGYFHDHEAQPYRVEKYTP